MNDTAVRISYFYRDCMSYFRSYKPELGEDHGGAPVCMSVCLSSRTINQNVFRRLMQFGQTVSTTC
jgi:hypothetical protein